MKSKNKSNGVVAERVFTALILLLLLGIVSIFASGDSNAAWGLLPYMAILPVVGIPYAVYILRRQKSERILSNRLAGRIGAMIIFALSAFALVFWFIPLVIFMPSVAAFYAIPAATLVAVAYFFLLYPKWRRFILVGGLVLVVGSAGYLMINDRSEQAQQQAQIKQQDEQLQQLEKKRTVATPEAQDLIRACKVSSLEVQSDTVLLGLPNDVVFKGEHGLTLKAPLKDAAELQAAYIKSQVDCHPNKG